MLIPIKYHKRNYPPHIKAKIDEIAGHFDVSKKINTDREFSLHTEYSYGKRKFNSKILKSFPTILESNKDGVPQLWRSSRWAFEFAESVKLLCESHKPTIIEIHPPFSDYTETIQQFLEVYQIFENSILNYSTETKIVIENRTGSIYKSGKFLVSKVHELISLCEYITKKNLNLRIALDVPQLLTAYGGPHKLSIERLCKILSKLNEIQSMAISIHLWGKRRNASGRLISHSGDLNTYFEEVEKKEVFLKWLVEFLNDGMKRYFVPEVNSSDEDLFSIVNELEEKGINFG